MNQNLSYVFWTGGQDSTFRILWLTLVEEKQVQPIYIIDESRTTWTLEISTIQKLSILIRNSCVKSLLYPINIYCKSDFPVDSEISCLFESVKKKCHIGTQYKWLAQFCKNLNFMPKSIELCMTKHEEGPTELQKQIFINPYEDLNISNNEACKLFSYYSFPLIHTSKKKMLEYAREYNFFDILNKSWFCHEPILNRPCGYCRPCQIAAKDLSGHYNFSKLSLPVKAFRRIFNK